MKKILVIFCVLLVLSALFSCENENAEEMSGAFDDSSFFKMGLVPAMKDGKWGFINKKMDFIIKPQFDSVAAFTADGIALVGINHHTLRHIYGYIDTSGEFIVEPMFESAESFKDGYAKVYKRKELKPYYINTMGEKCEPIFENKLQDLISSNSKSGRKNKNSIETDTLEPVCKDGKWGFADKYGEIVIEPQYTYVSSFGKNGYAEVSYEEISELGYYDRYNCYLINTKGEKVTEKPYEEFVVFSDGYILCHNAACTEFALIDPKGKIVATENDFEDIYKMDYHYY